MMTMLPGIMWFTIPNVFLTAEDWAARLNDGGLVGGHCLIASLIKRLCRLSKPDLCSSRAVVLVLGTVFEQKQRTTEEVTKWARCEGFFEPDPSLLLVLCHWLMSGGRQTEVGAKCRYLVPMNPRLGQIVGFRMKFLGLRDYQLFLLSDHGCGLQYWTRSTTFLFAAGSG